MLYKINAWCAFRALDAAHVWIKDINDYADDDNMKLLKELAKKRYN